MSSDIKEVFHSFEKTLFALLTKPQPQWHLFQNNKYDQKRDMKV